MLKNASRTWGFHDTEAEGSFDPLVGMLMGALAFELEQISGEIHGSESRIVEKLVSLLTPGPMVEAMPAHGIICAQPNQPSIEINPLYQFYLSRKVKNPENPAKMTDQQFFFTPAGNYNVFSGQIRYIATGKTLYEVDKEGFKEAIAENRLSFAREQNTIWIGMTIDPGLESVHGLSFFFDMRNELHKESFYQYLARAKGFFNDIPVQMKSGVNDEWQIFHDGSDSVIPLEHDASSTLCKHVNRFYRDKFLTIEDDRPASGFIIKDKYPPSLQAEFDEEAMKSINQGYSWVRIEFQQPLPNDMIENIFCSINCFPVINRKLNEFTYSTKEVVNVIPLKTDSSFFDMQSVSNSKGLTYSGKSFSGIREIETGSYILRQGIGRFDSRNATEILNYMIELLRDESAAFTVLGADMVAANLREMNQIISRLEQRLADVSSIRENIKYIMLKPIPNDDSVFVKFWSTNGIQGNHLKMGTPLTVYKGSDLKTDSIRFLSNTVGGRGRMDTEERLNAYRVALLSKDRIVTAEDIIALCHAHFGKALDKVEVKKGIMADVTNTSGFVRTIDVELTLSKTRNLFSDEELGFLKTDLQVKLRERSINVVPYRIF